ncbi:MAG: hypothetical protein LBR70_06350 [Lactobacillaceae bacterium]|nr:hypothetical protein [Lactobacillaceae bacterium]
MKKFFYLFGLGFLASYISPAAAQEAADLRSILISEDIVVQDKAAEAKTDAGKMLNSAPKKIEIKGLNTQPARRKTVQKEAAPQIVDKYGEAPFGLAWGSSINYTKDTGVVLKETDDTASLRSYFATYLPKPVNDFDRVVVFFGKENKLWRIAAYGTSYKDNAKGEAVLREYNKYSRLLEKKYGNKKETFIPKVTITERIEQIDKDKTEVIIEKTESAIGGDDFLQEIKNEEAVLYSTFNDEKIGVGLSIEVNDKNESNIIIDYKNLQLIKEQEESTFNAI